MSNSSDFIRWDIWIARVEFEEGTGSKIRPVLIIDGTRCYVLSLKITSHAPRSQFRMEGSRIDETIHDTHKQAAQPSGRFVCEEDWKTYRIGSLQRIEDIPRTLF